MYYHIALARNALARSTYGRWRVAHRNFTDWRVPSDFVPEPKSDEIADMLLSVWDRGAREGLEVAARLTETAIDALDASADRRPLIAVLTVLREIQLDMQLEFT